MVKRGKNKLKREVHKLEREVRIEEKQIQHAQKEIRELQKNRKEVRSFKINQPGGTIMANSITGVVAGQSAKFQALPLPAGAVVTGQPTWASDNALAVVTVDTADSTGLTVSVAVDQSATGSFNLSLSATNPDGSVATGTASVPVLPIPPPPPVAVTGFDVNQITGSTGPAVG